jgi:hypothetical protein
MKPKEQKETKPQSYPMPIFDGNHGYSGWERGLYEIDLARWMENEKKIQEWESKNKKVKP